MDGRITKILRATGRSWARSYLLSILSSPWCGILGIAWFQITGIRRVWGGIALARCMFLTSGGGGEILPSGLTQFLQTLAPTRPRNGVERSLRAFIAGARRRIGWHRVVSLPWISSFGLRSSANRLGRWGPDWGSRFRSRSRKSGCYGVHILSIILLGCETGSRNTMRMTCGFSGIRLTNLRQGPGLGSSGCW